MMCSVPNDNGRDSLVTPRVRRIVWAAALLVVAIVLVGRVTGPVDLHDQTQEKTSAYTTNLALNWDQWERWVLPMQQETWSATKPPLYNWLALPGVALTEGRVVWLHALPSMGAFIGLVGLVGLVTHRFDRSGLAGPIAVIALSANYAFFKLSTLVRPDTLLTLWLSLAWVGLTVLSVETVNGKSRRWWSLCIWVSMLLAGLTKGPAALIVVADLIVLGALLNRGAASGWRGWVIGIGRLVKRSGAWWGVPLAIGGSALWLAGVWTIDPDHAYHTLLRSEFVDRASGLGDEGVKEGPWDFVRTGLNMPFYFLSRWAPWSVIFIGACIDLWRDRQRSPGDVGGVGDERVRGWLVSAVVHTLLIVVCFSLAAGKRSDYIAGAYVSAAIVVGWCSVCLGWQLGRRHWAWVLGLGVVMAAGLVWHDRTMGFATRYPLGESLQAFAREVRPMLDAAQRRGEAVEFWRTGSNPLQTLLHRSQRLINDEIVVRLESQGQTWLVANTAFLEELKGLADQRGWLVEELAVSRGAQGNAHAQEMQVGLYHVQVVLPGP